MAPSQFSVILQGFQPGYRLAYDNDNLTFSTLGRGIFGWPNTPSEVTSDLASVVEKIVDFVNSEACDATAQQKLKLRLCLEGRAATLKVRQQPSIFPFISPSAATVAFLASRIVTITDLAQAIYPRRDPEEPPTPLPPKSVLDTIDPLTSDNPTNYVPDQSPPSSPRVAARLDSTPMPPTTTKDIPPPLPPAGPPTSRRLVSEGPSFPLASSQPNVFTSTLIASQFIPSEQCHINQPGPISNMTKEVLTEQINQLQVGIENLESELKTHPGCKASFLAQEIARKSDEVRLLSQNISRCMGPTERDSTLPNPFGEPHKFRLDAAVKRSFFQAGNKIKAEIEANLEKLREELGTLNNLKDEAQVELFNNEFETLHQWKTLKLQREQELTRRNLEIKNYETLSDETRTFLQQAAFSTLDYTVKAALAIAARHGVGILLTLIEILV